MSTTRSLLALSLLAASWVASASNWQTVPGESTLRFVGEAQGESFDGGFKDFSAHIAFDADNLESASFDVTIVLASADSQNEERDELMQGADFFDSAAQSKARYRATRFERLADGKFRALGELTLKGKTRPVALDFTWQVNGADATLDGSAALSRLAFDVGIGDWTDTELIGDTVRVLTTLHLRATSAP
ncbi:MAG: YceI family protein [Xanthomonadales bacterium]|nr:YceI family protein [Xanthomonadales bacterium]